jgi:hypothetical protein
LSRRDADGDCNRPLPKEPALRASAALAPIVAIALGVALTPPATAADAVDPTVLSALQQSLRTDSAQWSTHGGTAAQRCTLAFDGIGSGALKSGVRFAGAGGPGELAAGGGTAASSTSELDAVGVGRAMQLVTQAAPGRAAAAARTLLTEAGGNSRSTAYLTRRAAVLPILPRVHRALERHGLRTKAQWYRLTAADEPGITATYQMATDLASLAGFQPLLADGAVSELSVSDTGGVRTYRGKVDLTEERGAETATFVVDLTAGHLSRFVVSLDIDGLNLRCRVTTDFTARPVTIPRTPARHNRVIDEETRLASLVAQTTATPLMGGHRARIRLLQGYALVLAGSSKRGKHPVVVSETADGVMLTRTLKHWKYPLRWRLKIKQHKLVSYSVVTAPSH